MRIPPRFLFPFFFLGRNSKHTTQRVLLFLEINLRRYNALISDVLRSLGYVIFIWFGYILMLRLAQPLFLHFLLFQYPLELGLIG